MLTRLLVCGRGLAGSGGQPQPGAVHVSLQSFLFISGIMAQIFFLQSSETIAVLAAVILMGCPGPKVKLKYISKCLQDQDLIQA